MADINATSAGVPVLAPQTAVIDLLIPGFSLVTTAVSKYTKIDISAYLPLILLVAFIFFTAQYSGEFLWTQMNTYFMSTADVRVDDEMYNILMNWVAVQSFSKTSRRFVANIDLNSRAWHLWRYRDDGDDDDDSDLDDTEDGKSTEQRSASLKEKVKPLQYTPSFGTHFFRYKNRIILFRRVQNGQQGYLSVSEREEMSISSFGRNPTILKELLDECRQEFLKNDENQTLIYRGSIKAGTMEPAWTRCMSRPSRPFSTVVLDEAVKQELLDDMADYLHPLTRRYYSNRGIPYRRGYLLYGPPGTGKSSLSFAVAGYFKLKIYIVSLNSIAMNEENLSALFASLPKRCVVLLEDIDTAGLTHTRNDPGTVAVELPIPPTATPGVATGVTPPSAGRISLSSLLNVIDGVASQEGRVLIMTTNHLDKLDAALIRPGRVDMTVKFDLASSAMNASLFRGIFNTLEGDYPRKKKLQQIEMKLGEEETAKLIEQRFMKKKQEEAKVAKLAEEFATRIPDLTFSPAEVQGYLLKHKRNPEKAVLEAEDWVVNRKAERKVEEMQNAARKVEEAQKAAEAQQATEDKKARKTKKIKTNGVKDNESSDSDSN